MFFYCIVFTCIRWLAMCTTILIVYAYEHKSSSAQNLTQFFFLLFVLLQYIYGIMSVSVRTVLLYILLVVNGSHETSISERIRGEV